MIMNQSHIPCFAANLEEQEKSFYFIYFRFNCTLVLLIWIDCILNFQIEFELLINKLFHISLIYKFFQIYKFFHISLIQNNL